MALSVEELEAYSLITGCLQSWTPNGRKGAKSELH